jgi:hypothetical protein
MADAEVLRARFRDAAVSAAPEPWRRPDTAPHGIAVGGLAGVGFTPHPDTGVDLVMVASSQGRAVFDCASGARLARDRDADYDEPTGRDLSCAGIGLLAGTRVRIAGLFGGGLHRGTPDGWTLDVVAPDWPAERVILCRPFQDLYAPPDRGGWQVIHDETVCELRAVGFSPSGATLVIASSCHVSLFVRDTGV